MAKRDWEGATAVMDMENTAHNLPVFKGITLEAILSQQNLAEALRRVEANKGAPGVDGMRTDELRDYIYQHPGELRSAILSGKYRPAPVKRVTIPKPEKGKFRNLGIPTVIDRLVQQAVAQVLSSHYDNMFSTHSYGFRPGQRAQMAVLRVSGAAQAGYVWAVDMDLEKFFDMVSHSKLIEVLSHTITDGRVISLIHRYLNAGVIHCGNYEPSQLGVPQGGPLSPILSNIILNELDKELERRGHKFVRYADDLVIFCKSRKAAKRTYEHIVPFIEKKLFLKVNKVKTKVAYIRNIKFLSYAFGRRSGKCQYRLHPESVQKMKAKIRELTSRSNGWSYEYRKHRLQWYIRGWSNYFSLAGYKPRLEEWDSWLRHRIRMCIWKSWKRVRTRLHNLEKFVSDKNRVRMAAFCRKSYWRMSQHPTVHEALSDERLFRAGYPTFTGCYVDFNKARGYY